MERAIAEKNRDELGWALSWVRMGKRIASRRDHIKTWSKREQLIRMAINQV